jgi:hypothetical protein
MLRLTFAFNFGLTCAALYSGMYSMTGSLRCRMSGGLLRGTRSYSSRTLKYKIGLIKGVCYAAHARTAAAHYKYKIGLIKGVCYAAHARTAAAP